MANFYLDKNGCRYDPLPGFLYRIQLDQDDAGDLSLVQEGAVDAPGVLPMPDQCPVQLALSRNGKIHTTVDYLLENAELEKGEGVILLTLSVAEDGTLCVSSAVRFCGCRPLIPGIVRLQTDYPRSPNVQAAGTLVARLCWKNAEWPYAQELYYVPVTACPMPWNTPDP